MRISAVCVGAAAAAAFVAPARATWSIILIDTRTGEIAVGSATCLTGFDLRAATPVLIPGVGAATAQSFVDSTGQNRVFIRDRLALGVNPQDIVTQLASFDSGHQTRQYGIGDAFGRMATFSGTGAGAWAGGQTGRFESIQSGQVGAIAFAIQGNVLTGSPVVQQAVAAAIATPGDLPAKLMASMQAARLMGGDGRCSCSSGNPTGCGSPPVSFTKSAHIAYMLIARAGDTEGANGIYRSGGSPIALAAADLNGDQRPDLITANFSGTASVITNLSGSVTPVLAPIFTPLPANYPVGAGARGVALADMNGDTIRDLITAGSSANSVSLLNGTAAGTFTPVGSFPVGLSPRQVIAANFDGAQGPDIATANFNANNVSVLINEGSGVFSAVAAPAVDAGPVDLAAANVVGSAAIDLVVISRTANRLVILRGNGNGTFTAEPSLPTSAGPTAVVAADLDGDADVDIAVSSDTARTVQFFRNEAGVFTPVTYTLTFAPGDLAVGDVNGDTRPDIVAGGVGSFATLFNNGAGGFTIDRTYTIVSAVSSVALADLDGDGDLDGAFTASSGGGVVTVKNLGPGPLAGKFNDGLGCATGDYFMNFNVAFTTVADPDPVITLQGRFDQWRAGLVGRPDAVQSAASIGMPYIPSVGASTATMTITLRDWQSLPVTAAIASVTVTHAPGSPAGGLVAIGPVQALGGGVYRVVLTGGTTPGVDRLRVRVDDGVRPVTLMPDPAVSIYAGSCYANCDGSTVAPLLTANDFVCFLQKYAAQEPYANCDASTTGTMINVSDFMCYIMNFAEGCS